MRPVITEPFHAAVDHSDGVHVRDLPPLTTLLVRTMNSLYRVVITDGPHVFVQGGVFPNPTLAYVDGASIGAASIKAGWIGVGLLLQFRSGGRRIITSRVRAIGTEPVPDRAGR